MSKSNGWDTSYEWKAVLMLSLAFGLVGSIDSSCRRCSRR